MNLIEILTALLTPLIAIVTVTILVLQYILANNRWRLNLYDKRFAIYLVVTTHIANVLGKASLTDQENFEFLRKTKEVDFLFKEEVIEYIREIYLKGNDLILSQKMIKGQKDEKVFENYVAINGEVINWFQKQFDITRNIFKGYLDVTKK